MFRKLIVLPIAFLAFACSNDKKVDDALNSDLTTAAQARPYTPLDSITAAEQGAALTSNSPTTTHTAPAPVHHTYTTAPRSTSSGTYSSAPVYSPAPAPAQTVEKHTKRDAAIGGIAGAVIGATTSKNKVKGGLIGGAAGAILGAVIGNNVDKTKH